MIVFNFIRCADVVCSKDWKAFDCSDGSFTLFVSCSADCQKKRTNK